MTLRARRLGAGPILSAGMTSVGDNVNGPSLIRVPEWIPSPLGRYYLYFAHHDGRHIRLAVADAVEGPWQVHEAGVLPLARTGFAGHVASPDVHVDDDERRIRMYFHGSDTRTGGVAPQPTRIALSGDGLEFDTLPGDLVAEPYLRAVRHGHDHLALAMPGIVYRARDPLGPFERGPTLFDEHMRHSALLIEGDRLLVFHSRVGDAPERIVVSEVALGGDWCRWRASEPRTVLAPERDYEGAGAPLRASVRGMAHGPVRELRDPFVFVERGRRYLLYSVAGEQGIALAAL